MDEDGEIHTLFGELGDESSENIWIRKSLERFVRSHDMHLRDEIACRTSWMAVRGARRFCHRGEPFEDLVQVANIGLLKAIDRFNPSLGLHFGAYATPTILGELRRHFRDYTWSVHVPRQTKDLRTSVASATDDLTNVLGHPPQIFEIATYLHESMDSIVKVLAANNAYRPFPIEKINTNCAQASDPGFDGVVNHELISDLLHHLPQRQQEILYLYYFEELGQKEIAVKIGISQVHVGRLIVSSLEQLRLRIGQDFPT